MDACKIFGAAFRRAREARGLTQEEAAYQAGVAPGYLSQIENGHRNPSLLVIVALAAVVDALPADLLKEINPKV